MTTYITLDDISLGTHERTSKSKLWNILGAPKGIEIKKLNAEITR